MLGNMKVGLRLALGFTVVLAVMVAAIGVSLRQALLTHGDLEKIVKTNNVRVQLANKMIDDARERTIVVRDIMLLSHASTAKSRESIREKRAHFAEIQERYNESAAAIERLISKDDAKGMDLLRSARASAIITFQLQNQVIELAVAGRHDEAIAFIFAKAYPAVRQWIRDMDDFIRHNEDGTLQRYTEVDEGMHRTRIALFILGALAIGLSALIILLLNLSITRPLKLSVQAADRIASGDLAGDIPLDGTRGDEIGILIQSLNKMVAALRENRDRLRRQDWLKTSIVQLNEVMSGDPDLSTLAAKVISEVAACLDAQVGALYIAGEEGGADLSLLGSYAYTRRKNLSNVFKPGEGLVGQAALAKKQLVIQNAPDDYIKVVSGLGESTPRFICVTPLLFEGRVKGVVELATLGELTDLQMEYLNQAMPMVALAVESAEGRVKLDRSLEQSQALTKTLQIQQEELRTTNEELEEQGRALKASEEALKVQREELQVTNEELEEKNELLDRQKREVESARKDLEEQAKDLALASKYKSEFLANMSHELRTPLNSLLLLAQSLSENKAGNLTGEQVESARIIHGSGSDLLSLINEILDLSKIEAGRMDLRPGAVRISDLADSARASFGHMAEKKGIQLEVAVHRDAPAEITSDRRRIEQVIRNLMSNAIKFTDAGSVAITFARPSPGVKLLRKDLSADACLAISVRDTGIGISQADHRRIFEAFQQVDGSAARKYGGTGLGLSISRELARFLGGEIQIQSEPGKGSTFTFYLPTTLSSDRNDSPEKSDPGAASRADEGSARDARQRRAALERIEDDRAALRQDDRIILVVEDDPTFARLLLGKCHEKGVKCLAAPTGEEGLELAKKHLPAAIILDVHLPGMDGWAVLSSLKEDTSTRHIPVHIVSVEAASPESMRRGEIGYATKPLSQEDLEATFRRLEQVASGNKPRRVLLVEDEPETRGKTAGLIGVGEDVTVDEAATGRQALEALRSGRYDCVVLDLGLPDMDGLELLKQLENEGVKLPPVIVYTCRDLSSAEEAGLREHAESVIIKDVRSQERLLDEVSLFLHRVVNQMPEKQRQIILDLHDTDALLRDKKVLIVDDDMRTTFAMSRFLAERGMQTLKAADGERALRLLDEHPDVDLVLMDIMMPVMDGYEAMKRIRAQERFRKLPMIALTAKAMPEDRERCLASGANDYLPKPVDQRRLVSMMRVWLYR